MNRCRAAAMAVLLGALALDGCSRDSADWRAATAADTAEAYQQFLQQHPNSANAAQAHTRIGQLSADRDWQVAAAADTREAYEQFLAQHADSKWAQEARIRAENFAQAAASGPPSASGALAGPLPAAPPGAAPSPGAHPAAGSHTARTASAPAAQSAEHGPFVQLGAFSSKQRAQSEWKALAARFPSQLKSLRPSYVPGKSKGARVYRLRVAVSSESAANGLCATLKKHAQSCVPGTA